MCVKDKCLVCSEVFPAENGLWVNAASCEVFVMLLSVGVEDAGVIKVDKAQ
jgi:hypothetical protein